MKTSTILSPHPVIYFASRFSRGLTNREPNYPRFFLPHQIIDISCWLHRWQSPPSNRSQRPTKLLFRPIKSIGCRTKNYISIKLIILLCSVAATVFNPSIWRRPMVRYSILTHRVTQRFSCHSGSVPQTLPLAPPSFPPASPDPLAPPVPLGWNSRWDK